MKENNISLYNKLKIKFVIDFSIIGIFCAVLIILNLYKYNTLYNEICIAVFWVVYLIKTVLFKQWFFNSLNQTLKKDLDLTQESIMDMVDANSKQRDILVSFSKLVETFKNFGFKVQNFSTTAMGANTKTVE